MSNEKNYRKESAAKLLYQLARIRELHHRWDTEFADPPKTGLRRYQSQRLLATHADLVESPRYRPAVEFFSKELYGDRDFTRRDQDIERAYPIIVRTMPGNALQAVIMAVELNALSQELDAGLLRVLIGEFGFRETLDDALYVQAYRHCDNQLQRRRQIELISILGRNLEWIVAKPLVYTALRMARGPAHLAGFGELQQFIEAGFAAFRHMGKAKEFLATVIHRETTILDRIYTHHPRPFDLSVS
ncbi:MAG: hypothetical protein H6971_06005 [Gammaproteobacteria bacterium]|nr:hypothetical protein [Gammaproteobacteria bacterium]